MGGCECPDGGGRTELGAHRVTPALGVLVVAFIGLQWLIDRRDPKFVDAPARKDDDSVGFE